MWMDRCATIHAECSLSVAQVQGQANQACVRRNTQCCQDQDCISTGTEFVPMDPILPYFREELSISLRAAEKSDNENPRTVYGEQSPDTVELGGENLEYDESEGELRKSGSDISPLKGALSRAHLDHFI